MKGFMIRTMFGDINSNKFEKFLLFAIGAVLLVVIVITILITLYYPV